jgi:hypothetical protein
MHVSTSVQLNCHPILEIAVINMLQQMKYGHIPDYLFMTGICRCPAIEDYCTTKLFVHTPCYGQKKSLQKSEKLKKPEIIQDCYKFMQDMDRADQVFHLPMVQKNHEWTKNFTFFLLHMAAINSFILLKKYITN